MVYLQKFIMIKFLTDLALPFSVDEKKYISIYLNVNILFQYCDLIDYFTYLALFDGFERVATYH